ncbi:protein of unknown function [Spirosomataceae bacterium TFI 002]|nr:protein of unknown function [Spirosomataceae bacterium TFI 002]
MNIEQLLSLIPALALGIALSAASGFRIFIPLLVTNLASKAGFFTLAGNFTWMSSDTATIILIVAAVFELAAYYIPFIDNLLDTVAAPSAVVAGTLLTTSFLQINDPVLQWGLGLVAGGGVAGTIQAGTSLLRLGSSKFTGGLGNNFLATGENVISVGISLFSIWIPIFIAILVLLFVIWVWKKIWKRKKSVQ